MIQHTLNLRVNRVRFRLLGRLGDRLQLLLVEIVGQRIEDAGPGLLDALLRGEEIRDALLRLR